MRPPIWLSLGMAALCVVALAPWPYGFYQILRLVLTGYAIWIAGRPDVAIVWRWIFGVIAVLYNPIFKISLARDVHAIINVATAAIIVAEMLFMLRRSRAAHRQG